MAIIEINGKNYEQVSNRVKRFRDKYPISNGWGIVTELIYVDEQRVRMQAKIIDPEGKVVSTGYAEELRMASDINMTSAVENCETSCVGRAIYLAGEGNGEICSAEELANAISAGGNLKKGAKIVNDPKPKPKPKPNPNTPNQKQETPSESKSRPKQSSSANDTTGDANVDAAMKAVGLMPGTLKDVDVSLEGDILVLKGKGTFSLKSKLGKLGFTWNQLAKGAWAINTN